MLFSITREQLLKPLQQVCGVLASRPTLPIINNILLKVEGDRLSLTGTDLEVELSTEAQLAQAVDFSGKFTIPAKKFLDISKSLPEDSLISVQFEEDKAIVKAGRSKFSLATLPANDYPNLMDGRFPDYRRVLPRNADRILEADTEVLRRALMRAAILSNEKFRGVRLSLDNDVLKINANNPEQEEAEEIIDVNYQSPAMEVGFNVSYVLDVLNTLKCERVRFSLVDASSSCLIEDCDNNTAEYVIMPMRL